MANSILEGLLSPVCWQWQFLLVTLTLYLHCGFSTGKAVQYRVNQEETMRQCSQEHILSSVSAVEFPDASSQQDDDVQSCTCIFYDPQVTNSTTTTTVSHVTVAQETCSEDGEDCQWSIVDTYSSTQDNMWTDSLSVSVGTGSTTGTMNNSDGLVLMSQVFPQDYKLPAILTFGPKDITFSMRCGPLTPANIAEDPNTTVLPSTTTSPTSAVLLAIMLTIGICFFLGIIILVVFITWRRHNKKMQQATTASHGQDKHTDNNIRVNSYDNVIQAYGNDMNCDSNDAAKYVDNSVESAKSLEILKHNMTDTGNDFLQFEVLPQTNAEQMPEKTTYHSAKGKTSDVTTRPKEQNINVFKQQHVQHEYVEHEQIVHTQQTRPDYLSTNNSREKDKTANVHGTSANTSKWENTKNATNFNQYQQSSMTNMQQRPIMYSHNNNTPVYDNPVISPNLFFLPQKSSIEMEETVQYEKPCIDLHQMSPVGYGTLRGSKSVDKEEEGPQYANVWVTKSRTRGRSFNTSDKPSHYADIDIARLKKKQPSVRYTFSQDEDKPLNYAELELQGSKHHSLSRAASAHRKQVKLTPEEVAELYAVPVKVRRKSTIKDSSSSKQRGRSAGTNENSVHQTRSKGEDSSSNLLQYNGNKRMRNKDRRQEGDRTQRPVSTYDQHSNPQGGSSATTENYVLHQKGTREEDSSNKSRQHDDRMRNKDRRQEGDCTQTPASTYDWSRKSNQENKHRRQEDCTQGPASTFNDQSGNSNKDKGEMERRHRHEDRSVPKYDQYDKCRGEDSEMDAMQVCHTSESGVHQRDQTNRTNNSREDSEIIARRQYQHNDDWQNYRNEFSRPDRASHSNYTGHSSLTTASYPPTDLVKPNDLSHTYLEKTAIPAYAMYI